MKFKLDMLDPAVKILKIIVILLLICAISYLFKLKVIVLITGYISLLLISTIIIGVIIELKQDAILSKKHKKLSHHPIKTNNLYECQCCGARFESRMTSCPTCGQSLNYYDK